MNRFEKPKEILFGRSQCPHCKKKLGAIDLVPVLSYIFLRGRCRFCKKPISIEYPILEIVCAALAYLTVARFGLNLRALILFLSLTGLIVGALRDIKFHEVELGIFIFGVFYLASRETWMGLGDVLFAVWIGILAESYEQAAVAIFSAFLLGALFGIIVLAVKKEKARERRIAFGPFLAVGGMIGVFAGLTIFSAYLKLFGLY